jgi:hypothetical protein
MVEAEYATKRIKRKGKTESSGNPYFCSIFG